MLTGAIAGFAAGLLGVGGGLIIVPVLFFIFNILNWPMYLSIPVGFLHIQIIIMYNWFLPFRFNFGSNFM